VENAGRLLLYAGLGLAALGLALMLMGRAGWSWRPLPGDILIRRPGVVVFAPVATMLLVSVLGTLLLVVLSWLRR
jgi:hypothetical protein